MPQAQELWRERLNLPAYRVGEAAHYAEISPSVVAYWQKARGGAPAAAGERETRQGLSFVQLIEVAVVAALRRSGLTLQEIREARAFIAKRFGLEYPFAQARFKTDGADLLLDFEQIGGVKDKSKLIVANRGGQLIWKDVIYKRLRQFNYGEGGGVESWKVRGHESPIRIDPRIAFGAPQVNGTPTWVLKERWRAGENVADIADDFDLDAKKVIRALKFEGLEVDLNRPSLWH